MVLRISLTDQLLQDTAIRMGSIFHWITLCESTKSTDEESDHLATTLPQYGLLGWPEEGEDNTVHLYDASAMLDYEQTEVVHPRVGKRGLIRQVGLLDF